MNVCVPEHHIMSVCLGVILCVGVYPCECSILDLVSHSLSCFHGYDEEYFPCDGLMNISTMSTSVRLV